MSIYLTHAGHAGNEFFDYLHDDRLSFVGAVLIRRRQTRCSMKIDFFFKEKEKIQLN